MKQIDESKLIITQLQTQLQTQSYSHKQQLAHQEQKYQQVHA